MPPEEHLKNQSTQASDFYDQYHRRYQVAEDDAVTRKSREVNRGLLRWLDPQPGIRMLDLSCGQGLFLQDASRFQPGLEAHGLDHSSVAVAATRRRVPKAVLKVGDALKTGYPTGRFDLVTCLGALEHYPDPDKGLAEIKRILKPGGRALVYVPNLFFLGYIYLVWRTGETPHEAGQNEFEHFETRQGWEDRIRRAGLEVLEVRKYNEMFATQRMPAWMKALYRVGVQPFIPLNLSYCFGFLLRKK